MRECLVVVCIVAAAAGCKKSGGGGGGWLVGDQGMLVHVDDDGVLVKTDELATDQPLYALACRYAGEAWAAGAHGTVRYTVDDARTWTPQAVPTTADLHALATLTTGPIFIGGDGVFLVSRDSGTTWTAQHIDANLRSLAASHDGSLVLAVASDGGVWSYDGSQLVRRATVPGARAVALDGTTAFIAGAGIARSDDGGSTWRPIAVGSSVNDLRVSSSGDVIAVGAAGTIVHVDANGTASVEHVGSADLHAIHIAEADGVGFAAGDGGELLVSDDGGATWAVAPRLPHTVWSVDEIGYDHR
jgi:photosystem II stability/assembly factor-like uncharacterized protein